MPNKWSYSSLSLFQQCPKKYYHLRIAKDVDDPPSQQIKYGLEVHKAAEDYVRDGKELPLYLGYIKPMLDALLRKQGEKFAEQKLGLTADLEPCSFHDKNVWWRGIADLTILNPPEARVLDYKTGKSQYADVKQLEILALAIFKHYPEVEVVKAGLLFVVHKDFIKADYDRAKEAELWNYWRSETSRLDSAYANDVWNPKQNFTCRAWCPVVECVHNGKR